MLHLNCLFTYDLPRNFPLTIIRIPPFRYPIIPINYPGSKAVSYLASSKHNDEAGENTYYNHHTSSLDP